MVLVRSGLNSCGFDHRRCCIEKNNLKNTKGKQENQKKQKKIEKEPRACEKQQTKDLLKKEKEVKRSQNWSGTQKSLKGTTRVTTPGLLLQLLMLAFAPYSALGDSDALNLSPLEGSPNGSVCDAMGVNSLAAARGSGGRTWELCLGNHTVPINYTAGFMDGAWTPFGVSLLDAQNRWYPLPGDVCWFHVGVLTYLCSCFTCFLLGCPTRKRKSKTKRRRNDHKVGQNSQAHKQHNRISCARRVGRSRCKPARMGAYLCKRRFLRSRLENKRKDVWDWKHLLQKQKALRKLQLAANSKSFDAHSANWLKTLPVRGGAAGAAATKQKRKQGSINPGSVPQHVLRTLIHGLKQCLQNGTSLENAVTYLENMSQPKHRKKKAAEGLPPRAPATTTPGVQFWDGKPYAVDQHGWWTWVSQTGKTTNQTQSPPPAVRAKQQMKREDVWVSALRTQDWDCDPPQTWFRCLF